MSRRIAPLLMAATLIVAGCGMYSGFEAMNDQPAGKVEYTTADGEEAELTPVRCASGQPESFHGADFVDAEGKSVRLVVDPMGGATLRVFSLSDALEPGLVFQRSDCERFTLDLERTGWEINDVYDFSVRVDFACRNADGASASGTLESAHCH